MTNKNEALDKSVYHLSKILAKLKEGKTVTLYPASEMRDLENILNELARAALESPKAVDVEALIEQAIERYYSFDGVPFEVPYDCDGDDAIENSFRWLNEKGHLTQAVGGYEDQQKMMKDLDNIRSKKTAPKTQGWQPIDTAPKDGTEILVIDGYSKAIRVVWYDFNEWHVAKTCSSYRCDSGAINPILWMPLDALPTPPTEQSGG